LSASGYTVHSYRFLPRLHTLLGSPFGDFHCSELPFIFAKASAAGRSSSDMAAAACIEKLMGSAWAGLAGGQAPAGHWPPFDSKAAFPSLLIDGAGNNRTVLDLGADVCALWDTVPF